STPGTGPCLPSCWPCRRTPGWSCSGADAPGRPAANSFGGRSRVSRGIPAIRFRGPPRGGGPRPTGADVATPTPAAILAPVFPEASLQKGDNHEAAGGAGGRGGTRGRGACGRRGQEGFREPPGHLGVRLLRDERREDARRAAQEDDGHLRRG